MLTRNRPSISLPLTRVYSTAGLPTRYFNAGELELLLELFHSIQPEIIIEFGVNTGRNAVAAINNISGLKRYIGIDVVPDYKTIMPAQRKEIPAVPGELALGLPQFELIIRPRGSFDLTVEDLPQCDAVFIDGDHSRYGVLNDYKLALDLVRPGGIIIFHDDNCLPVVEVTQTLNDLVDAGHTIIHVENSWLAYEMVR